MNPVSWLAARAGAVRDWYRAAQGPSVPVAVRRRNAGRRLSATVYETDERDGWTWIGVDAGAVMLLAVIVTVAWLPTFGNGWVWVACLVSTLLGVGVGVAGARWRLRSASVLGVVAAVYVLAGSFLAMPSEAMGFVLPTLRTLHGLAVGPVLGWKSILSVVPPLGDTGYLLVPVVVLGLATGVVAMTVSLRSGRPTFAWTAPVAAILLAFVFGTRESVAAIPIGLVALAIVLVWVTYRRGRVSSTLVTTSRELRWTGVLVGAVVLALSAGVAGASTVWLGPDGDRVAVRDEITPPLDIRSYASPLQGFRRNITDRADTVLFSVTGLPQGSRVRIATLDAYDGFVYSASNSATAGDDSGEFRRIGASVDDATPGREVSATVTMGDLGGVWVPTVGQTREIRFTGGRALGLTDGFRYNQASGTGVDTVGLEAGDTYQVTAVLPNRPSDSELGTARQGRMDLPDVTGVPDVLRDVGATWQTSVAGSSAGAVVAEYVRQLRLGYYSHGQEKEATSLSGHSTARLATLLKDTSAMVGDEEQYAVTLALLARNAGIPARVVYGYITTADDAQVTGADVSAWTEVYYEGIGWVAYDPAPPKDRTFSEENRDPRPVPRPQVENPPPAPDKPEQNDADDAPPVDPAPNPPRPTEVNWRVVGTVAAIGGIPLLTLIAPMAIIIAMKMRRRRERMGSPDLVQRVSGGWAEIVDRARDLGASPSRAATRTEQADELMARFGRIGEGADPRILARQADATIFSPDIINAAQAATYWAGVDQAIGAMNSSVPWTARVKAAMSVTSLRRYRDPSDGKRR